MHFQSLLPPTTTRPKSQLFEVPKLAAFLRNLQNNFSLSTWLLIAAVLATLLTSIIPKAFIVAPALILLVSRFSWTVAVSAGLLPNPYLSGAIHMRTSAQVPDAKGEFSERGASESVACFHLGAKLNHPLGIFSPNAKDLFDRFINMVKKLDETLSSPATAAQSGYLGGASFERRDINGCFETVFISYWRSAEDIHNWAYGPVHRETWEWWNRLTVQESKHIGINHEIFVAGKGDWETVYINHQPTLLGATTYLRQTKDHGGDHGGKGFEYLSPLIEARRGILRTSAGRLGKAAESLSKKHGYTVTTTAYEV